MYEATVCILQAVAFFCIPKTPGYAGEFRKSFSGEYAIKTPFAILEVRSGNCIKEAKGGHPK